MYVHAKKKRLIKLKGDINLRPVPVNNLYPHQLQSVMVECETCWGGVKQTGRQETQRWGVGWGSGDGGRHAGLRPLRLIGTWADNGGLRGINQGHVDALRAVLWTDDLSQALWTRLAQQLTCKTKPGVIRDNNVNMFSTTISWLSFRIYQGTVSVLISFSEILHCAVFGNFSRHQIF